MSCTDRYWILIMIVGVGQFMAEEKKRETAEVQLSISADILSCGRVNKVDADCHLLVSDLLH